MIQRYEGQFPGQNNAQLFHQVWKCDEPRGKILITHGLAEHSDCYDTLAQQLAASDWEIWSWDLRGHGRSPGKRGYIGEFQTYIEDLKLFVDAIRKEDNGDKPFVLFGHSLGGLITIKHVLDHQPENIDAVCLSAPALGLAFEAPKYKTVLADFAAQWLPKLTMYNEIKYEDLSRDQKQLAGYGSDTLRHDKISPAVFLGMLAGFEQAVNESSKFKIPLLLQVAGNDRIVSPAAAQNWFRALDFEKKKMHIYSDSYHEIFNDLDRDEAFQDLKGFLGSL